MAITAEEIRATYPLPVYNYRVEVGDVVMSFSEVSGLSSKKETTTYKESSIDGKNVRILYMPAQPQPIDLSLKRGILESNAAELYDWYNSIRLNMVDKKDITISLLDQEGQPRVTWVVINAFPTGIDLPTFDANANDVAVESLSLMADSIQLL